MRSKKTSRIAIGATCLVVAALVMGWFVGQYIPGEPRQPEPPVGDGIFWGTERAVNGIVDYEPGSTLSLRGVAQGQKYDYRPSEIPTIPDAMVEHKRETGVWEYEYPDIEISILDAKAVATESIADLYPYYRTQRERIYEDSKLLIVSVTITNGSDEPLSLSRKLPRFTLWSRNLGCIDDSLGAGAYIDGAYYFLNSTPVEKTQASSEPAEPADLQPGESRELEVPFKINKNNLKDQTKFGKLDPADFCLQVADYGTGTAHRLWL